MLYMLGKSMVGLRAEQIIVLAEAQRRRMGLLTEIVAHGNASIAAAHACAARQELFSDIHCRHPPKSWADSVRKEEFIPFVNVVNGALLDYDWTDLIVGISGDKTLNSVTINIPQFPTPRSLCHLRLDLLP